MQYRTGMPMLADKLIPPGILEHASQHLIPVFTARGQVVAYATNEAMAKEFAALLEIIDGGSADTDTNVGCWRKSHAWMDEMGYFKPLASETPG